MLGLAAAIGAGSACGIDTPARVAHDTNQEAARVLHPPKMPTSYLIDRAGNLRHVHAGFERADASRIESELLALAEQPSP